MSSDTHGITGIGNVLVDVLINETDQFLTDLDKEKGGMTFIDNEGIDAILSQTSQTPVYVPGGATCNTIVGVGSLGGKARFIGRRGDDELGRFFEDQLTACGVKPVFSRSASPTGKALSIVTPDAQRSMFTFMGASTELDPAWLTPDLFKDSAITMVEGYLLYNPDLITAAMKAAQKAGSKIALDLASFEMVNSFKPLCRDLIKAYVDILIANEDEALAYTGHKDENQALEVLSQDVELAALKVGKKGSFIRKKNQVTAIEPVRGKTAVDTTGAGDLWAAGFLFGLARGFTMEKCGRIASACGYEVCRVMGAQIPEDGWKRIRQLI